MPLAQLKYNPGIHGDEELIESFVVRHRYLDLILEVLRENTGAANQHILVVGPRGCGKTTLVRRIAAEVRRVPALDVDWYPLVFAEESYLVSSAGEFWLEALFHLGDQTQDGRWTRAYQELREERDEDRLRQRSLAQLMDFATEAGKRVLLIVENLNMLLGEQMTDSGGWELRHTLLNESRVMFLGTATSRFEEIKNIDQAWFELFAIHELRPLGLDECNELWRAVTGEEPPQQRLRPIQILTGGNPRLLKILGEFAAGRSFRELMSQLVRLIDDHTEYFKSHLDNLAPTERKVFVTLLDIWDPVSARTVAQAARLDVNKTSSLLNRLAAKGAVDVVGQLGRRKLYQAAERLFNIYYLMRRRGHPSNRVRAAVSFMVRFYEEDQLVTAARQLAEEACHLNHKERQYHYWAYHGIIGSLANIELQWEVIRATPEGFLDPETHLIVQGMLLSELDRPTEAEEFYRKALEIDPGEPEAWFRFGRLLSEKHKRYEEAERSYRKVIEINPDDDRAWFALGILLHWNLERYDQAETAYRRALRIDRSDEQYWARLGTLGLLLHEKLERHDEAEQLYRESIELHSSELTWTFLGKLLHENLKRYSEAAEAYRKAIEIKIDYYLPWTLLGKLLHEKLERYDEAEEAYRRAIELQPDYYASWALLGKLLHEELERYDEAEEAYRKAIALQPDHQSWTLLGQLLHEELDRYDEAEEAYRKAIELQVDFEPTWTLLGQLLHEELQRYGEAEKAYRKSIELQPDSPTTWTCLGILLHEELVRYDEAERAYAQALEVQPDHYWAWTHLGDLLHERLGRHDEAEGAYRKGYELSPDSDSGWTGVQLASFWSSQHRWSDILEIISPILNDAPDFEEAVEASTRLLIDVAAGGFAEEALQKLTDSQGLAALEPLAVGLQIFLGRSPRKAQEILEIGQDVADRIRRRQAVLADRRSA